MKVLILYSHYMVFLRDRHQPWDIPEIALVFTNQTCKEVRSKFLWNGYSFYTLHFSAFHFLWYRISSSPCNHWTRKATANLIQKGQFLNPVILVEKEIFQPNVMYNKLKLASSPHKSKSILKRKRKMDYVDWESAELWDVEQILRRDLPLLPVTIKRNLCQPECSLVPITNNQLGVRREIELLEAFRGVEWDPSSTTPQTASPVACNITQDEDIDVGEELTVRTIVTRDGSGKKMETKTFSKKPKLTNLTIRKHLLTKDTTISI